MFNHNKLIQYEKQQKLYPNIWLDSKAIAVALYSSKPKNAMYNHAKTDFSVSLPYVNEYLADALCQCKILAGRGLQNIGHYRNGYVH